jgi:5,10-methylene-tetrahydrofolate dehydrogenase/methenyl tetrahydrofolate cyclohydrolase
VIRVMMPVMMTSLNVIVSVARIDNPAVLYHCHGANPGVVICNEPKLIKPDIICAENCVIQIHLEQRRDETKITCSIHENYQRYK